MSAAWYRRDAAGDVLMLTLQVQPNARRTQVAGLHGEALKVQVAAPALENRANEALIAFLAEVFEVPRRQVNVKAGEHGRRKIVEVRGSRVPPEVLLEGR